MRTIIRVFLAVIIGGFLLSIFDISARGQREQSGSTEAPSTRHTSESRRALPQLVDITSSTNIRFNHLSAPENKYIVESMSGGVALIDYDRDGWPDIYFTNAPDVDMQLAGKKARSATQPQ